MVVHRRRLAAGEICDRDDRCDKSGVGEHRGSGQSENQFPYTHLRHGHARKGKSTGEYFTWQSMIQRCKNPNSVQYPRYGGRGISVCEQWNEFAVFLRDMGERPSPGHSIDRFPDKNGNYEPGNCRWATRKEQGRNTRQNRLITIKGETRCLIEWAEHIGINKGTITSRLDRGWDEVAAILTPPMKIGERYQRSVA
jgi:hypothetical protein